MDYDILFVARALIRKFGIMKQFGMEGQDTGSCEYRQLISDIENLQFEIRTRANELEKTLRNEYPLIPRGCRADAPSFKAEAFRAYSEWLALAALLPDNNQQNLADIIVLARRILREET